MTEEERCARWLLNAALSAPELAVLEGWTYADRIWCGGMGAVALVQRDGKHAALKFILPEYATEPTSLALFEREVANMQALRHKHIVELFGAGVYEQTPFFLMEFCDGGSVWDLGRSRGGLGLGEAAAITFQILEALHYGHQAEIPNVKLANGTFGQGRMLVHRDVKPQNMLLHGAGPDRIAKLADYGLAKARSLAGVTGLTAVGSVGGTAQFMPRQQLEEFLYARPEVDVWATAASLYWMLTLRFPRDFGGVDALVVVAETAPVPIRSRGVAVPASVADLLDETLNDSGTLRFQSASAFQDALKAALRGTDAESAISVG